MTLEISSLVLNGKHGFTIKEVRPGRIVAGYILTENDPPDDETKKALEHKLCCVFNSKVKVIWDLSEAAANIRWKVRRLIKYAERINQAHNEGRL